MTRINLVDPSILTDKHLMAEYKEITRPFNKVIKRIDKGDTNFKVPEKYVLGSGHETFFFNKLSWLFSRYGKLYTELKRREFKIDTQKYREIRQTIYGKLYETEFWNGYEPIPEEIYLNMARLCVRSNITDVLMEICDA